MFRFLVVLAVAGLGAGTALSQSLYTEVTASHLPPEFVAQCMDADHGDVDGDGDLDLVLAMEFGRNLLLRNDGTGRFRSDAPSMPRTTRDSEDVALVDVDLDGDLDLVFVSEDDQVNELFINDGSGRYTDASDRIPVAGTSNALAVLDLDGDGALDLLIGNSGQDRALLNDGAGRFVERSQNYWRNRARTQDLELADVDGDGDLDLIVANEGQNQLFLNAGDGWLADATAGRLPMREDESREIKAADVDADGDLDLVVANVRFVMTASRQDFLLINDGTGRFSDAPAGAFPAGERDHFTVQVVDLDGDGDIDVLLPSTVFTGRAGDVRVLLNDGRGRFAVAAPGTIFADALEGNGFDIEVADFNADGRDDLFFCNRAGPSNARVRGDAGGRSRLLLRRGDD